MKKEVSRTEIFESVPVPKAILSLAVPTIISQMISVIYNLADTFYVGRTGDSYKIAGVSLSLTIFLMTIAFANLFGIGGGSLVARLLGRKDPEEAKKASSFAFWGAAAVAVTYSLLLALFLDPLLRLLGASDATIGFSRQYVIPVVIIGGIPNIMNMVMAHLLRNTGYSKQASMGLSGGGICNIILDPLFMFVLFPKGQEVLAAAIATMVSNFGAFVFLLFTYRKVSRTAAVSLSPRILRTIRPETVREVFAIGIPTFVLTGLFDAAHIVFNARAAMHGDLQLAAAGIVMKIERVPNAVNVGICQGMMPIVAYNYSSGNRERMRATVRTGRIMGLSVSAVCIVLLFLLARPLSAAFISQTAGAAEAALTLGFAAVFLRIRCFASPFQFMNYHSSYCLQAVGDGKGTLLHAVFRDLVFYIPLMIVFDLIWQENGLMAALPVGEALGGIFALWLITRRLKKDERKEKTA